MMSGMKWRTLFLVALLSLVICGIASACPMCKDSIPSSDAAQAGSLPGGFNTSVYLMLISFFCVLGLTASIIYKGVTSTNVRVRGFEVKPPSEQ
jgi:hypothetical protein